MNPDTIFLITTFLLIPTFAFFAFKRLLTYMHLYQQEEYDSARLSRWMLENWGFDKRVTLRILPFIILALLGFIPFWLCNIIIAIGFTTAGWIEKNPLKNAKKKLVLTQRAKRIFYPAFALAVISSLWVLCVNQPLIWLANIQLLPFLLMLVNGAQAPYEKKVQKTFRDEAYKKLQELNPKVIGITGSFGKTSVKHILGHILKSHAPTLITPGSVNTEMGITRIIREQLDETHQFFIAEMGAYGIGSIKKLTDLTHPDLGIITTIGAAHYERFKTLDTVADAKFELAQAVAEKGGVTIIPDTIAQYEAAKKIPQDNLEIVGDDYGIILRSAEQDAEGLHLKIEHTGEIFDVDVPLFGLHHADNVVLAFEAAMRLGLPPNTIIRALKSMPQITHRLEHKPQTGGWAILDDAYNSNPQGFKAALETMKTINPSGRNILITPGMVELGAKHDEAHKEIGERAGEICDVVIAVKSDRIPTFMEAVKKGKAELIEAATFENASLWLNENVKKGDLVLLENDLPDLYEQKPKF